MKRLLVLNMASRRCKRTEALKGGLLLGSIVFFILFLFVLGFEGSFGPSNDGPMFSCSEGANGIRCKLV